MVDELLAAAEGHLVGSVGPRYFGFVVGGSTPAATAADLLAVGWDQNAFNPVLSPAAEAAERAAGGWVKDLLGLPGGASVGFVTGAQAANTVGIACGRHHVLEQAGHDVETDGLVGAPRVRVVTGSERHATIDRSLRLLGLGTASLVPVLTDDHGTVDLADLEQVLGQEPDRPTIVCLQAGNVNTGASDLFAQAVPLAKESRRLGARGRCVRALGRRGCPAVRTSSPASRRPTPGPPTPTSGSTCPTTAGWRSSPTPPCTAQSMAYSAAYLAGSGRADFSLGDLVPDSSRRARGFAVWAALRELGRSGVEDLVERTCVLAARMADRLAEGGATIANDVVLNQVLVGVRRRRSGTDRDRRRGPAGRYVLARRHHLARPAPDPHLGLQRHHHRGRHRPFRRRHPGRRGRASAPASLAGWRPRSSATGSSCGTSPRASSRSRAASSRW